MEQVYLSDTFGKALGQKPCCVQCPLIINHRVFFQCSHFTVSFPGFIIHCYTEKYLFARILKIQQKLFSSYHLWKWPNSPTEWQEFPDYTKTYSQKCYCAIKIDNFCIINLENTEFIWQLKNYPNVEVRQVHFFTKQGSLPQNYTFL